MKKNKSLPGIIKRDGRTENFSSRKLYRSLSHSGLPKKDCKSVTQKIEGQVLDGQSTQEIFQATLNEVRAISPKAAVRYSLKKSLFELGPSGHHFETYVSRFYQVRGYRTQTCQIVRGKFVKHEVDVIAFKNKERIFIECKFHNRAGIKNDIKIALYVKSRWDDLKTGPEGNRVNSFVLASNTSFSKDALTYAAGTHLNLLGVNAPEGHSFFDQIREMNLWPLTSLRFLKSRQKEALLSHGIVLVQELIDRPELLEKAGVGTREKIIILEEAKNVLGQV